MSGKVLARGFDPEILVFDEAHELSDLVVSHSGLSYNWTYKKIMRYCEPIAFDLPQPIAVKKAIEWLDDLLETLKAYKPLHPSKGGDVKEWRWHKNKIDEVDIVLGCLAIEPHCWFVRADEIGITIRPKTAKYHFKALFEKAPKIVMMSATISPRDVESLGIEPGEYEFVAMPNPIPLPMRPVHDLQAPPITAKSTYDECKTHAQIIANVFNDKPDHWNGVVHMPSKKKSEDWGEWLHQMTRRPVYVPERGLPTDEAYQKWLDFEADNTGAVAVAWNMMTGIDGKNININITGCVPYPNFGDTFEKERFNYNKWEAKKRVANLIEQQQGRNRRGFAEHYGPMAQKFNGIADGKWTRLKSAMQRDFLESVV
jgi:Rad3-related DNA helicase